MKQIVVLVATLLCLPLLSYAGSVPVSLSTTIHASSDTMIAENFPNKNYSKSTSLKCGYDDSSSHLGTVRSLVNFNLAPFSGYSTIQSASFQMYLLELFDEGVGDRTVSVFQPSSSWDAKTITWANAPSPGDLYASSSLPASSNFGWYPFDVSLVLTNWLNGSTAQNGLLIEGSESSEVGNLAFRGFSSREGFEVPKLVVRYTALTASLLINGSFIEGDYVPYNWSGHGFRHLDGKLSEFGRVAHSSVRIYGYPSSKTLSQDIDVQGAAGAIFQISGWSKALNSNPKGGYSGLIVKFSHADGSKEEFQLPFPKNTHNWMKKHKLISPTKDFIAATVLLSYSKQRGTAWFSGLTFDLK